jgi:DNA-binding NarL/FixJ family response regulator
MKILIADDYASLRKSLKRLLTLEFEGVTFGEAEDGPQALAAAISQPWDLVILDISMPGCNGLEVLKQIRACRPLLRVLMFSSHAERQYIERAFRNGANGYLTKDRAADELIQAVKHILAGGCYVSAMVEERPASVLNVARDESAQFNIQSAPRHGYAMVAPSHSTLDSALLGKRVGSA